MEQNLLIKELLRAFFWIGETDRLDRPIRYINFYSTWCFLPHSVKSILMEGVENDLILFDRTLDMGGGMMSDLGDEFAWVPRSTERGHQLVSSNLGIKRRSQEEIAGPHGALYWDGTSEFVESWKNIKSSPEESIRLTAKVMANGWNDSDMQIAHILDVGVSPDEIEPYVEISSPIWIPKHSPVSVNVAQVSGAFGVESAFIQGKDEPDILWLTSEIRGPLPDEFLYSTMTNHSNAEHTFSELILGQEPPFVYCVWDDDKDQYHCMEITDGTGMTINIEKWLGDKWNYVLSSSWPSAKLLCSCPRDT